MLVLITKVGASGALIPLSKREVKRVMEKALEDPSLWPKEWNFFVLGGNHRLHAIYRLRDAKSPAFGKFSLCVCDCVEFHQSFRDRPDERESQSH